MDATDSAARAAGCLSDEAPARTATARPGRPGGARRSVCFSTIVALVAAVAGAFSLPARARLASGWARGRAALVGASPAAFDLPPLPERLSQTGLFVAGGTTRIDPN